MYVSATSWPIAIKFHCGRGKAALCFGQDRIITVVSMATLNFHWVIMGETVLPIFLSWFSHDYFILSGNKDVHESL